MGQHAHDSFVAEVLVKTLRMTSSEDGWGEGEAHSFLPKYAGSSSAAGEEENTI